MAERCAFVLFASMGDIVYGIPTLYALKRKYPTAQFDWHILETYKSLVPDFAKAVHPRQKVWEPGLRTYSKQLRRYDHVFDLQPIWNCRRDPGEERKRHLMDMIATWAGVGPLLDRHIKVPKLPKDVQLVNELDLPPKFIAFCSSPCRSCRDWPTENRVALIAALKKVTNIPIVTVGGTDGKVFPGTISMHGRTHFNATVELIKRSCLYIGPDTGTSWLACAEEAERVPKLCFTCPQRKKILKVGFEGVVHGTVRDLCYTAPVELALDHAKKLLNLA